MDEVSGRVCVLALEAALAAGGSASDLLDGLSFTAQDLRDARRRVGWDEHTVFLERCREQLGGYEALEELGARHVGEPWPALMRAIAGGVSSPATLYALAHWIGPSTYTCTRGTLKRLPGGRIEQTVEILPGFRDSPEFFYGMLGVIRATPRLLGMPEAAVEMKLDRRRATYEIVPPPSRSWWWRLRQRMSRTAWLNAALEELSFRDAQLQDSERQTRRTAAMLADKSRQLDRLNQLGVRLARHLNIDELATAVTKLMEEDFKAGGLVFWVLDADSRELDEVRRWGTTAGAPTRRLELQSAGRRLGELWLWKGNPDSKGNEDSWRDAEPPIDSLAPWLALAVDNALTFEALARQSDRLEREIDMRRRTERQLFQAQKLEALGGLARGIAHDFHNILTAIRGYTEFATRHAGHDDSPLLSDLEQIQIASDRGSELIEQLLQFSRGQLQELRHVEVNQEIARLEPLLQRLLGDGIELEISAAPDVPRILADVAQLDQVIVNLVINSRDALPGGGCVSIRTSSVAIEDREVVRIEIEDNGAGMSEETRMRIFEPFFTTKEPGRGSGLGLSTVYGIVSQSKGRLDVKSALGVGTTVTVELPIAPTVQETIEATVVRVTPAVGSETVLLVEDDAKVLELAREVLSSRGYQVIACQSSLEALEHCQAGVECIDVLVADVVMPQMTGVDLARRVRSLAPGVRSILMSGYAQDYLRSADELDGVFLRKPFTSDELLQAMRRALAPTSEAADDTQDVDA